MLRVWGKETEIVGNLLVCKNNFKQSLTTKKRAISVDFSPVIVQGIQREGKMCSSAQNSLSIGLRIYPKPLQRNFGVHTADLNLKRIKSANLV